MTPIVATYPQKRGQLFSDNAKQIMAVVVAWNEALPKNHVRVITEERRSLIQRAVTTFTADTVKEVIAWYGKRAWNVKTGNWAKFDNWMQPTAFASNYEEYMEAQEKSATVHKTVAPLVQQIGKIDSGDIVAARKRVDVLPVAERRRLFDAGRQHFAGLNVASEVVMAHVLKGMVGQPA